MATGTLLTIRPLRAASEIIATTGVEDRQTADASRGAERKTGTGDTTTGEDLGLCHLTWWAADEADLLGRTTAGAHRSPATEGEDRRRLTSGAEEWNHGAEVLKVIHFAPNVLLPS